MDIKKAREDLRKGKTIYDMQLKVAYYGRVSTDKDDQLNSLENQQNYFEDMIRENKNWIFTRGYIDEGISGTAVKNRDSFLKMIEDATLGKIDLILTKEISRFSRNTVDSIKYTEYLLKQGVIVYFLSDNLNIEGDRFYESNKIISNTSLSTEERETFIRCRHNVPWAKFVKRDVVVENNIRYEECKYSNDVVFNITLGCIAKKIRLIDEVLYVLTNREGSLTSKNCEEMEELYIRTKAHIRQQAIIEKYGYMGLFAPALWFIPRLYNRDLHFFMKALKFARKEGLSMLSLYKGMIRGRSFKSRIKVLFFFLLSYFYLEF